MAKAKKLRFLQQRLSFDDMALSVNDQNVIVLLSNGEAVGLLMAIWDDSEDLAIEA